MTTYNPQVRALFSRYNHSIIRQFVKTLPVPSVEDNKFYNITTEDNMRLVVWGSNNKDVINRFNQFLELIIFY